MNLSNHSPVILTMSRTKQICVLGGTGFVGRTLVRQLACRGYQVTVLSRHPERHRGLLTSLGVRLLKVNIHDSVALEQSLQGMDAVINLVGILNQFRYQSFRSLHVELPRKVMRACWKTGTPRLLHMSALNADAGKAASQYLRTKGEAEDLLHVDAGDHLNVTRIRPSVIFGSGDQFFNRFAQLLQLIPVAFPLACSNTRFAPVYVGDVAQAFIRVLDEPFTYDKRYDLCGPHEYTLAELVAYTAKITGLKRSIVPLGSFLSRAQAVLMSMVPGKPFSLDNYYSMQVDSICTDDGLARLGIAATPLEEVVPGYIGARSQRARYTQFRRDRNRKGHVQEGQ